MDITQNPKKNLKGKERRNAALNQALYYTGLGMCWTDVVDKLCEEFGYKKNSFIGSIVTEARKLIFQKQMEYSEGIALRNIARIETIIQDAIANGERFTALKAMDLLNKTANVYNTNIKIDNDNNKSFEIKLSTDDH